MNLHRTIAVALLALAGSTDRAAAGWFRTHPPEPTVLNGTAGRSSWAGVPGIGRPLPPDPKPGHNPVVGSVTRTGHFAHPGTGRTRYTGTFYNPTLGTFSRSSFRK
ncbi:unnamed protein product [Gemmataceae bacterium]|nr:unnamed protein product [Gemmataceae bacterium]VTU00744.1 unnamed protein product [Gemmataceae bacterium]